MDVLDSFIYVKKTKVTETYQPHMLGIGSNVTGFFAKLDNSF